MDDSAEGYSEHLQKLLGDPQLPRLRKNVVPAAKRVRANLLKFAAPEIARVVRGKQISRLLQRVWQDKLRENSWALVAATGKQSEGVTQAKKVVLTKIKKQISRSRDLFTNISH